MMETKRRREQRSMLPVHPDAAAIDIGATVHVAAVGGRDSQIAALAGFKFQELDNTIARRRRKYGRPLRERRKAGRKPLGDRKMTTAERVRKHRAKHKDKTPATHRRNRPGAV
jgi:hypothetical protein